MCPDAATNSAPHHWKGVADMRDVLPHAARPASENVPGGGRSDDLNALPPEGRCVTVLAFSLRGSAKGREGGRLF